MRGLVFLFLFVGTNPLHGGLFSGCRQLSKEPIPQDAGYEFETPVRLEAGGKPIQIESPGYASPTIIDLDRDGKDDLVVGQFAGGKMQLFRNIADAGENPRYEQGRWIESEVGPATVPGIRCCTSSTPQFVDWNKDGQLDILSGSYAIGETRFGHLQLLVGLPNGKFQTASILMGNEGKPVQTEDSGADPIQATMDTLCTHPHAVDFDGDGDLDLFVGTNGGRVFYFTNQGDSKKSRLTQTPEVLPLRTFGHRSAPHTVDWDDDGDSDLLVGTHEGAVIFYQNLGKIGQPTWASAKILLPPTELFNRLDNSGQRGDSARIWVADWNNDGVKDLIVGDRTIFYESIPGMSVEQFQTNEKAFFLELEKILAFDLRKDQSPGQKKTRVEIDESIQKISSQRKWWTRERGQGFVWLYLGKRKTEHSKR